MCFQVVLLCSRSILSIFQVSSILSNSPISKIFGETSCLVFIIVQFASLWQTVLGGFGMALYRYLCLEKPTLFHKLGQERITKIILIGEFLIVVISVVVGLFIRQTIGNPTIMAFCLGYSHEFFETLHQYKGLLSTVRSPSITAL